MMKRMMLAMITCLNVLNLCASEKQDACKTPAPCYEYSIFADGLYWRAYEDGLDYVIKNNNGAVHIDTCGQVERAEFDRTGGFRTGAGCYNKMRDMGAMAYWTRFHTRGSDALSETFPVVLFPVWTNPGSMLGTEQDASACVKLDLDMLDAQFYGKFSPTCAINVMPMLGVVYARINQIFNINSSGAQSTAPVAIVLDDDIDMCNDYWGVGPKMGLRSFWDIGCGLRAFGHFDFALLYGKFDIKQNEHVTFSDGVDPTTFLQISCNRWAMCRPRFDIMLGLAWQGEFRGGRQFDVQVGWEQLYFFGQNQLLRFFDDVNAGANMAVNGDLALQGLTVRVGFGF